MLAELLVLNNKIDKLKKDFTKYISDKDIPIEDRWAVFKAAPSEFRTTYSDICITDNMPFYKIGTGWLERYQIVDMIDYVADTFGVEPWDVNALELVEYLLQNNCGGYVYEW